MSISFKGIEYRFTVEIWRTEAPGGWHFVSLPKEISMEIRQTLKLKEQGWGRMNATAKIGQSQWQTAIWFDTKKNTYLLALKAEIRKKENLSIGNKVKVIIWV